MVVARVRAHVGLTMQVTAGALHRSEYPPGAGVCWDRLMIGTRRDPAAGRASPVRERAEEAHVPTAIDDWVFPHLPYRSVRGDVVMSLGILVLGVVVALTGFARQPAPQEPAVAIVATVVAAAALLVKRRRPGPAALVIGAALAIEAALVGTGMNLAILIALFDVLYVVALLGSDRERRMIVALCVLAAAALLILPIGSISNRLQAALSLLAVLGTPLFIGTSSRQREALVRVEKGRAEAERGRADAVVRAAGAERRQAVRAERAALARDLHDAVAAHLSAIALQSGAAMSRAGQEADPAMRAVRESSLEALRELRQLIDVLSADDPGDLPLKVPPGLEETEILEADAQRLGVPLRLDVDVPREALTTATSHVLMRIAREGVVNAARHARGTEVTVRAGVADDVVELTVTNPLTDGRGELGEAEDAERSAGGGLGTVIMAEQAAAVGGHCVVGPDGDTWRVRATVPRHRSTAVEAEA